ncbi:MAG: ribonuclease HI [Alphaproteobacteria bacterium]|nr:ribonuclease HI [Alphaproteobacteria bacterium]
MAADGNPRAEVFIDGACIGNPGPGGWGVLALIDGEEREWSGGHPQTTNQRMELMGAIKALELLPVDWPLLILTDSQYVKNGITDWIKNWRRNKWRNAQGKPVANQDLWKRLEGLAKDRVIEWQWIRGHAGNPGNERADRLAESAARIAGGQMRRAG